MEDNNKNINVGTYAVANTEERMHPIFEECEVMNAGKPAHEHMLSMNGMYISGITDEQLKEMHEKLTELLTGEKPAKYFYGEVIIPAKDDSFDVRRDFVVDVPGGDKFPIMEVLRQIKENNNNESLNFDRTHVATAIEISRKDFDEFTALRCGNVDKTEK